MIPIKGRKPSVKNDDLSNDIIYYIDTAINHAEIVEYLHVKDSIEFNKWIKNSKLFFTLKYLYFENVTKGNLEKIFQACSELDSLQTLEIIDFDETVIPNSIGKLNQITSLALISDIRILVPDSICFCTNLKEITLGPCKRFPILSNLPNLEKVYLSNSDLKEVPKQIFELINIKEIDLANNDLETIPERIIKLKQLKVLDIANNPISKRELRYYQRYKKYNELSFLFDALPNCDIILERPLP